MDTLTHIVLGACIGEAIAGKQLGKKAILIGAVAQNIPDIDFVASFVLPTTSDVLAHRGFTHSFTFLLLSAPLLAYCSKHVFKCGEMNIRRWTIFFGIQLFIHIFIDSFNAYGTGWFEPFSHYRVSFNSLFVADPLFSIWPAIAMIMLLVMKSASNNRTAWVKAGLGLSALYLLLSIGFKIFIDAAVEKNLTGKGIPAGKYFTTPTPLNNMLWYIVSDNDSGYYIGYRSIFDSKQSIDFHYVCRNDSLLKTAGNKSDINKLLRFSQGYYAVQLWHDTVVFNDLRFGEELGWAGTDPKFVFHYFLQYPGNNEMIVQRGRFAGWDKETVKAFLKRIKGN